jgi:hypothetical protein
MCRAGLLAADGREHGQLGRPARGAQRREHTGADAPTTPKPATITDSHRTVDCSC